MAAAPGQPTHVLESDQVAEHIPGCNMAFRREALEAINGFDPQYRKAGDDVDVCWRLQQAGYWITFAPGAFVWHHRRQSPRAYLRQQAGYGEAEALLRFKHPDQFNGRGDGKWRGVLYGASLPGPAARPSAIIYRGTFGTGLFQCLYQPGPAHWAMLPEHAGVARWPPRLVALAALFWPLAWVGVGGHARSCRWWSPACRRPRRGWPAQHDGLRVPAAGRRRCVTPSRWSAPGRATAPGCSPTAARRPTPRPAEGRPRPAADRHADRRPTGARTAASGPSCWAWSSPT